MLNRLSDFPATTRPTTAPATASGSIVSTVMGWRNELNWLARTMYATRMPIEATLLVARLSIGGRVAVHCGVRPDIGTCVGR